MAQTDPHQGKKNSSSEPLKPPSPKPAAATSDGSGAPSRPKREASPYGPALMKHEEIFKILQGNHPQKLATLSLLQDLEYVYPIGYVVPYKFEVVPVLSKIHFQGIFFVCWPHVSTRGSPHQSCLSNG